jgi:hypothetical protein
VCIWHHNPLILEIHYVQPFLGCNRRHWCTIAKHSFQDPKGSFEHEQPKAYHPKRIGGIKNIGEVWKISTEIES